MNRNTILYILVALLVVSGLAWLVITRSSEETTNEDALDEVGPEETTEDTEEAQEDSEADQTNQNEGANGAQNNTEEVVDAGEETSAGSASTTEDSVLPTGGAGEADVVRNEDTTVSGISPETEQEIRGQLEMQTELLEALVSVVALELEAGNITQEEAADMIDDLQLGADELEVAIETFNQNT